MILNLLNNPKYMQIVTFSVLLDLYYTLDFSTDFAVGLRNGMLETYDTLSLTQYDVLGTAGDNGSPQRFSE